MEWSEERLEFKYVVDDSQDIDNDEDNCPHKKVKIVKQIKVVYSEKSTKKEMEEFAVIKENGVKPNNLEVPFQDKGPFKNWWK